MSGLHRRNSSALYQQLTPQPGGPGDITNELESYSSATPRPRTGSLAAEQRALEALEEKEGFIPDSQYDLPGSGRRSAGRRKGGGLFGWKSKLLLTMLLGGGIGAAAYFYFYSDTGLWWEGREQEEVVSWTEEAATKASQAAGSAATGVKHFAFGSEDDSTTTASATYYLNEGEYDDAPYEEEGEEEEDDSSSNRKTTLASNATSGSFSSSASADVTRLLENGTLAAYRWHETLPSLNGSSSASTYKKQDGGRLIVVGDVHGTHTSLLRLLKRLSFSPSQDTLIHTGDILAKSSLNDSLTTVSLLRRFGAKGVRGNHDQKVIEWRKWMEAYGPLDRNSTSASSSSSSSKALKGVQEAVAAIGSKAQAGFAAKQDVKSGFRKVAGNAGAAKLNAPSHPREKAKRGWLDWLTGGAGSDDGSEELLQEQDNLAAEFAAEEEQYGAVGASGSTDWRDEDAQAAGPDWDELNALESRLSSASDASATSASRVAASTLSNSSSASSSTTTPHRRPFGRPTSLTSSSPSSSTRSSSSSRPPSTATSRLDSLSSLSSSATSSDDGSLTGPLYSWLSPSLSSSELKKLGVVVPPEGWEWGGEHFEIARHLSKEDVEYLEELPLTLWVEEIKSWVVHAGMVPWTSLSTTLSRLSSTTLSTSASSSSALPSLLSSTSPLSFSPSTSLSRLLSHSSSRTAILLEPLNTDPYTLLNMRTLHSSPSSKGSAKVKGPSTTWTASSKGRKAGKGSRPWWAVWEEGMRECAEQGEAQGCEEAGVVYGHWAGQGLQVQPHSIGLDTGCAYGRRLSALVVPLSSSSPSSSKSPLGSALSPSTSHRVLNSTTTNSSKTNASYTSLSSSTTSFGKTKGKTASSSSTSVASNSEPTSTSTSTRARPNWHGGMEKVTIKSVASALASSTTAKPSASSLLSDEDEEAGSSYREEVDSPVVVEEEEEGEEGKPWWRPWKRGDVEQGLEKRGPPQGRPGVAPWSSSGQGEEEEEIEEVGGYEYAGGYEEEVLSSSTTTTGRGRPSKTSSSFSSSVLSATATDSSTSTSTVKAKGDGKGKTRPSSSSATVSSPSATSTSGAGRKLSSSSSAFTSSDDDEDEAVEVADLASEEEEDESAFEEQEVHLAATGEKGQMRAWVVSVDCGGDFDTE